MLARRWRGIRRAFLARIVAGLAVGAAVLRFETRTERPAALAVTLLVLGVVDTAVRAWRTWRLQALARDPEWVQAVHVTRHYRGRSRLPGLHVAGLWPDGPPTRGEPPMSVRVEDVGKLPDGGQVQVWCRLRPRRHILIVHRGEIVWTLRRVRRGLHPPHLGPYPPGGRRR